MRKTPRKSGGGSGAVACVLIASAAAAASLHSVEAAGQTAAGTPATAPAQQADPAQMLEGKPAPAFSLPDQNDKLRALSEDRGKWVVLAFYPADMTSGCTFQNRSYSANKDKFTPLNAVVYTVSTQDTKSKQAFCSKEGLTHTLLSDVGGKTSKDYGVLRPNGSVARRVTFYIAPDGTIAAVDTKPNVREAADQSLATLASLSQTQKRLPVGETDSKPLTTIKRPERFTGPADAKVTMDALVPDFGLPDTATGKISALTTLSAGKKATVIVFLSTQCLVSSAYNERIARLAEQYGKRGVQFIGISSNVGEAAAEVAAHARQNSLSFPVLKDANNVIADRFEAKVTPEVFVTNEKGILIYHGAIDDKQNPSEVSRKYLADTLEAVLAGKPVGEKTSRAFGCAIARAKK